jgi:hypothetical protein
MKALAALGAAAFIAAAGALVHDRARNRDRQAPAVKARRGPADIQAGRAIRTIPSLFRPDWHDNYSSLRGAYATKQSRIPRGVLRERDQTTNGT